MCGTAVWQVPASALSVRLGLVSRPNASVSAPMPAATMTTSHSTVCCWLSSYSGANLPEGSKTQVQTLSTALSTLAVAGEMVDAPAVVQRDALGLGLLDLEVVGGHVLAALEAGLVDLRGAEAASRARRVDGHVAAADHEDLAAAEVDVLAELDVGEEGEGAHHAVLVLAGHAQLDGLVRARRHEDGVEPVVLELRRDRRP